MRSVSDDRTARAVIRDEALRLFAERGPDAVSVRQVATAAGVSPALVVHHFGSRDGLVREVNQHVLATFEAILTEVTGPEGTAALVDPAAGGSLGEMLVRHLPADSPMTDYLRRLLLADGAEARAVFQSLFALARRTLDGLVTAGVARPGADPAVRAAFLLANDLAVFLLRDRLTELLGTDPLSAEGLTRWAPEVLAVYAGGLRAEPSGSAGETDEPDEPDARTND